MQKFQMILKNEKKKLYDRMTLLILLFHAAAVAWVLFSSQQTLPVKLTGFFTFALLVFTLYVFKSASSPINRDPIFAVTAVMTFVYWCLSGYWWMGIITIALFFLYFVNNRKLIVRFYRDKIEYPSFPKRTIKWDELNNVILKDDWLTIDFKNNRIIQQFTEVTIPAGNEKEFNDFCRQLLNQ